MIGYKYKHGWEKMLLIMEEIVTGETNLDKIYSNLQRSVVNTDRFLPEDLFNRVIKIKDEMGEKGVYSSNIEKPKIDQKTINKWKNELFEIFREIDFLKKTDDLKSKS